MPFEPSLFLLLFSRTFGFFFLSPLFSALPVPSIIRFALSLVISFLLVPLVPEISVPSTLGILTLTVIKEFFFGYLLGLIFSLLLESAALAGQIVGTLSGFSASELLDPISSSSHPLWSKLFTLFIAALLFAVDLHHGILKILFQSFTLFPMSGPLLKGGIIEVMTESMSQFFQIALEYAALPLLFLSLLILLFAFVAKMLPEFPIFWMGFPLQVLIGIGALMIAVIFFSEILQDAFTQCRHLIERIFFDLRGPL